MDIQQSFQQKLRGVRWQAGRQASKKKTNKQEDEDKY